MAAQALAPKAPANRWLQLSVGVVCMVMIANLQYGWTYFVNPMKEANNWALAAIQVAFSLFVLTETWLIPIEGWFVDKFGPKFVVMVGGVIVSIGWSLNSVATSLPVLYLGAIVSGVGAGCVYGTCVGNALKWFADRRGLAARRDDAARVEHLEMVWRRFCCALRRRRARRSNSRRAGDSRRRRLFPLPVSSNQSHRRHLASIPARSDHAG